MNKIFKTIFFIIFFILVATFTSRASHAVWCENNWECVQALGKGWVCVGNKPGGAGTCERTPDPPTPTKTSTPTPIPPTQTKTPTPTITKTPTPIPGKCQAPVLSASGSCTNSGLKLNYSWNSIAGTTLYRIQVSSSSNYSTYLLNKTLAGTSYSLTQPAGTYYARVKINTTTLSCSTAGVFSSTKTVSNTCGQATPTPVKSKTPTPVKSNTPTPVKSKTPTPTKSRTPTPNPKLKCAVNSDCGCRLDKVTNKCAIENVAYLSSKTCTTPDLCRGISGKCTVACVNQQCVLKCPATVTPTKTRTPTPSKSNTPTPRKSKTPTPVKSKTPTPIVSVSPTGTVNCPDGDLGNLDCDSFGLINEIDLTIMLNDWSPNGPAPTPSDVFHSADITGDGNVNETDLTKLLNNWKVN